MPIKIKRGFALLVAVMVLFTSIPAFSPVAFAEEGEGPRLINFLLNPDFSAGKTGWNFPSGTGTATNNPYPNPGGGTHAYIDGGGKTLSQNIIIQKDAVYKVNGWISCGGTGAVFGIRKKSGEIIKEIALEKGSYKNYEITDISLNKGDEVQIYITSGGSWVNCDLFFFGSDSIFERNVNIAGKVKYGTGEYVTGGQITLTSKTDSSRKYSATISSDGSYSINGIITDGYTVEVGVRRCAKITTDIIVLDDVELPEFIVNRKQYEGNLLVNPDFDYQAEGWTIIGGGANASNNPYPNPGGGYHTYLNGGTQNRISQEVVIDVTGIYKFSGWISTGGPDAKIGIKYKNGEIISEVTINSDSSYKEYVIKDIALKQDDVVEVYVTGGKQWVNADHFSFVLDKAKIVSRIANGGFEEGTGYWTFAGQTSIDSDVVRTGNASLKMVAPYSDDIGGYIAAEAIHNFMTGHSGIYVLKAFAKALDDSVAVVEIYKNGVKINETNINAAGDDFSEIRADDISVEGNDVIEVKFISKKGTIYIDDVEFLLDISKIPNEAPVVSNAVISGRARVGYDLVGSYEYQDPDGHDEGDSIYEWYIGNDGEFTKIEGEDKAILHIKEEYRGKRIKFRVTAVDVYGGKSNPVESEPTDVIDKNFINNPGFEQDWTGWTFENSANIKNKSSVGVLGTYDGLVAGYLAPNANSRIIQLINVEESGEYVLSAYIASIYDESGSNAKATLSILNPDGTVIASASGSGNGGYSKVATESFLLEKGGSVKVVIAGSDVGYINVDEIELLKVGEASGFNNILRFVVKDMIGDAIISKNEARIEFTMPYGTDISALTPYEIIISEGASISPAIDKAQNFEDPVQYTVTSSDNVEKVWTVVCKIADKTLVAKSSNEKLQQAFAWCVQKAMQWVQTGKTGVINMYEGSAGTDGHEYIPSYWAGYKHRSGFYIRDYAHQVAGAAFLGLNEENYSMLKAFADTSTEARKWYALWALNFDGSPLLIDYKNDNNFVREVPAMFELVEKGCELYKITGDQRYISEDMLAFYERIMNEFIELHDTQIVNGVAEGTDGGIFQGSATYNEMGDHPIEAGDGLASQYRANVALADLFKQIGNEEKAQKYYDAAEKLKKYFIEEWGVPENDEFFYNRGYDIDGKKLESFAKEGSWFMAMKGITPPGERTTGFLQYIHDKMHDNNYKSPNIEAYTYLPDTFFPYGEDEKGWYWMEYIIDRLDDDHAVSNQGKNADYPEVSFTLISQTIGWLLGVNANVPAGTVETLSHLPEAIADLEVNYIPVGNNEIKVKQKGTEETTFYAYENGEGNDITWIAKFAGKYDYINVNGKNIPAKQAVENGREISYAEVEIEKGKTYVARPKNAEPKVPGGPVVPIYTEPEKTAEDNISTDGDMTIITINEEKAIDEIKNSENSVIIFDLSEVGTTAAKTVEIPENVFKAASEYSKDIIVKVGDVELLLEKDTFDSDKLNGTTVITVADMGKSGSMEGFVQVSNTFDIIIKVGDTNINPDKPVKVTINTSGIENGKKAAVYYYNPDKGEWEYVGGSYDEESRTMTFDAEHFSEYAVFEYNKSFKDIEGHWAKDTIEVLASRNIVSGIDGENYKPQANVTRAEFAKMAVMMLGLPLETYKGQFADVAEGKWYADIIETAYNAGIINGDGGYMRPDSSISREEMAAIAVRVYEKLYGYELETFADTGFADEVNISNWAKDAVGNAAKLGIIVGKPGNIFDPKATATRAEAATVIYRLIFRGE